MFGFGRKDGGSRKERSAGDEGVTFTEKLGSMIGKRRFAQEEVSGPHTVVTVIKNRGREDEQLIAKDVDNVLGNAFRVLMINAFYDNTSPTTVNSARFMALSASDRMTTIDATNAFAGEIETGGLQRAAATVDYAEGTANTFTVEHTFMASAAHANVQKVALFNAASAGTKAHEVGFTPVSVANADTLTVEFTGTLG